MKAPLERLVLALCPHVDLGLARSLYRRRFYRKLANYLLVEFQLARGHSLSLGKPYWLTVDPTNFCQLQCPFCPTGAGRGVRDKSALTLAHFTALLDQLGPYVVHLDLMNWGEPLLNKDLPKMIACAKSHGIEVKVDANLNDLSETMAEELVRSGLDILSVSIDGASQETYQTYRVGGNFRQVLENAGRIARKKTALASATPHMIWQFLVFKHNEHETKMAGAMAAELGMEFSMVSPFMPNEPKVLAAWLPESAEYRRYAPASVETPGASLPLEVVTIRRTVPARSYRARRFRPEQLYAPSYLLGAAWAVWLRGWAAFRAPKPAAPAVPYATAAAKPICKWPWAGMAVNPDGSAAPCCSVEDQGDDFGVVFGRSFWGLWNGARYRASRRHVARYVRGQTPILPQSDHVCERCTAIGHANFEIRPQPEKPAALD